MTARPRARRWAVPLVGLLLTVCLSGLVAIGAVSSVAAAKRNRAVTQPPAVGSPAATGGASTQAPAPAGKGTGKGRREKGGSPSGAAAAPEAGSETDASRKARHPGAAKGKHQAAKKTSTEGPATGEAGEEGALPSTASPAAQNTAKRHKEIERERRRERREARKAKERENGQEGSGEEGGGTPVSAPQPVSASVAASSPVATSTDTSLPTVVSSSGTRAGKGKRAHRQRANRANRVSPALAGASALPSLPAAAPATQGKGAKHAAAPKPSSQSRHGSSPLGTTVTKIINVVPAFMRFVIAGLLALALALALNTRYATRRAERLVRQRRELLEDVGLLQAALLPELPASLGGVGTTAAYRPASGPAAGGDFYDLFALEDGRLAVIVGDVSGHGRKALPHTTLVRFTLRAYLEVGMTPRSALQAAAPVLERQLGGSFATVVLAIYDPASRTLLYSCAGHPHPVLAGAQSTRPITACSAPPIGVGWPTGTRQTEIAIPGGSRVCFYTDGVIEAKLDGGLFGVERLEGVLAALAGHDGAGDLLESVAVQSDEQPDDMAACLLDIEGSAQAPTIAVEEVEVHRHELTSGRLKSFLAAGGLSEAEIEGVITQASSAVLRDGSVVLKLRPGNGRPRVELAHDNVARMRITARSPAGAREVAV